ncbi:MAG: DUF6527 family protein [Cyanobacteria bacterium J06607_15]
MFFRNLVRKVLVKLKLIAEPNFNCSVVLEHPTPAEIRYGQISLVATPKIQKWACFKCPGGCGETISLSLSKKRRPRWTTSLDWLGRPSIHPSIRQQNQCRCHYWIRKGVVNWCRDTGRSG